MTELKMTCIIDACATIKCDPLRQFISKKLCWRTFNAAGLSFSLEVHLQFRSTVCEQYCVLDENIQNRQKHENLCCAGLGCKSFNMIWNVLNITQTPTTYTTTAQWTIYGRRKIIANCFGAHILQSKHTIRLTNFLSFLLRLDILNSVWHRKNSNKIL